MKITIKQCLLSLIFPALIIVEFSIVSIFFACNYDDLKSNNYMYALVFCTLAGIVLSIFLTIVFSIDTSELLKFRIIYLIICTAIYFFYIGISYNYSLIIVLPILSSLIEYIVVYILSEKIRKLLVIILSDPKLYYSIALIFIFADMKSSNT